MQKKIEVNQMKSRSLIIPIIVLLSFFLSLQTVHAITDEIGGTATGSGGLGPSYVFAEKITASDNGNLSSIGINWYDTTAGNVVVGIYSDNAGTKPNTLLANTTVAMQAGAGWQDFSVTGVNIVSGTVYWLAADESAFRHIYYDTAKTMPYSYYTRSYDGNLDSTWSSSSTQGTGYYNMRMTYSSSNATSISLLINGTTSNATGTYGDSFNITAKINTTGLNVELYRNGTLVNNGTTNVTNITTSGWFANATYEITASYPGNATYTASSITRYITVNKASTTIHETINGTEANATYTYPAASNVTAWKTVNLGNLSIYRNGAIVNSTILENSTINILQLAAGIYNYTAVLNHENYTASPVTWFLTVIQLNANTILTSSAGWNIVSGTSTTISCTASYGLSSSITQNGVGISNPYTATIPTGAYLFVCSASDTQNYSSSSTSNTLNVLTVGVGCVSKSQYIYTATIQFSAPQIVLDFSSLVANNVVNSNLGDVNVTAANITSKVFLNTTHKLFLVNSSNVSSFVINFGNYFINNSYSNITLTNQTLTSFNYSQLSSNFYTVNLLNELNGSYSYPLPSATASLTLFCNNGADTFNISQSTFNFPALMQLNSARVTVTYSPTSIYYRDLLVSSPIQFLNFYVIDATQYQVVQLLINLQDNTGTFTNSVLKVTRQLGGTEITITQLHFDLEKKAIIYLQNGGIYNVYITSGSNTRGVGNLFVDNVNLIKTITLNAVVTTDVQQGNVTYNVTYDDVTGVISMVWLDPFNNTRWVNMTVYNGTDGTQMPGGFFSTANSSNVAYSYTVPNKNETYKVLLRVYHNIFGDAPWSIWFNLGGVVNLLNILVMPSVLPSVVITIASGLFIFTVPMFFDELSGATAGIMAALVAIALAFIKIGGVSLWPAGIGVLAVALVLAILNKISESRRDIQ